MRNPRDWRYEVFEDGDRAHLIVGARTILWNVVQDMPSADASTKLRVAMQLLDEAMQDRQFRYKHGDGTPCTYGKAVS